jgi:membrane protein
VESVRSWLAVAREVKDELKHDNLSLVAAGVAFYALMAIFPAIIATVTVYALVADPAQVRGQLAPAVRVLPKEASDILVNQLTSAVEANSGGLTLGLVVSLLATIWAAAGGMNALITGLNVTYGVEETRNFLKLRALSLGLTFGALVTVAVALALVAAFPVALHWIGLGPVARMGAEAARWVVLIVVIGLSLGVLYRFAPAHAAAGWRWLSVGTVVALVGWLVASLGFSIYVSHFGSYNKTYGSLAGVIVLLLWLWLSTYAILLGAEIDAVLAGRASAGFAPEAAGTGGGSTRKE